MSSATHINITEDNVSGLRRVRFQLKVDDEIVPGLLQIPDKEGPFPLVFIQHPGLASKDEIYISGTAKKWAEQYGWACVALDAPGHGERAIENALDALRDAEKASIMSKQFAKEITVITSWFAPKPSPILIARNKYANSSGSLIAARNLIIERAPTSPSDKASDDLTIEIINIVVIVISKKFLLNNLLFDSELPYLTYIELKISARTAVKIKFVMNPSTGICILDTAKNSSND